MILHEDKEQLSKYFTGAAYRITRINEDVMLMSKQELQKYFTKVVISKIEELKKTGTIEILDELIQLTPPGIFEMMRIKGLGGKKLEILWKKAGIDSMNALLDACQKNEVAEISGFGIKTQKNIISAIEQIHQSETSFHFATVAEEADKIVESLKRVFKSDKISLCGAIRRKLNTVSNIEILSAVPLSKYKSMKSEIGTLIVQSFSKEEIKGQSIHEHPFTIYLTSPENFYSDLFQKTGNKNHVDKVMSLLKSKKSSWKSETEIYEAAHLPFIVPELREDVAEWNFKNKHLADSLITDQDIKGVVHNHTTYSDGIDTLENFVTACIKKGFEYVVIADHSKNAFYAGGMKEEKVLKQHAEIDKLNKKIKPFKIFKSIECDILISGELDFSNNFLKYFDLVIVSIHQLLKMDEKKATDRLIKAIENPFTAILGHMTGRQHLIRPGYPVNFKKVIDACAANNVIIEINANPYRLDMDWSHIPYALKKGVMISVNPDAHSIGEIDNIHWGVVSARKGGLTKEMTWNALSLNEIKKWIRKKYS